MHSLVWKVSTAPSLKITVCRSEQLRQSPIPIITIAVVVSGVYYSDGYLGTDRKYWPTDNRIQLTRRPAQAIIVLPFLGGVVVRDVQVIRLYSSTARCWSEVFQKAILCKYEKHHYLLTGLSGILDILNSGSK